MSSLEDPGALSLAEMAACISDVDGNFAWLRDVTLANDVEWLDRGYRGTYVGTFTKADPEQKPKWKRGDLLFASMGMAGVFVFDVSERRLDEQHLIGHLHIQDQSALLLQLDPQRGVVFAGGNDYGKSGRPPVINAWDVRYVNASPKTEIKPSPAFSVNKPWSAGHLAVDPTGMGLLYTWSNFEGPIAVPIDSPEFRFSGLYLPEEEDLPPPEERQDGEVLPSIQKLTQRFVPLGVPRVVKLEEDDEQRAKQRDELEAENTAAFKVRLSLPGSFGDKLTAKVESLRTLPELRHLGKEDLGAAIMPPGGPGWPDASVTVTLRRLGVGDDEQGHDPNVAGGEAGHFSEAFNLYESEETILLLADPRARQDYMLQDLPDQESQPETKKSDEKATCRNCDWPQYFPDPKGDTPPQPGELDDVKELLAGRYVRALLFVDPEAPAPIQRKTQAALDFFERQGDNYPTPSGYADIAAPADAVPSPIQASLAEPAQNPAMWSPGEAGVAVALAGGDLMLVASDHVVKGRGFPFTFDRVYRSHMLGYGPLGSAGWGANLFAHLREIDTTGEVEYHDGNGHVWRFYPNAQSSAEEDAPVPDDEAYDEDKTASYNPPKGVYLRLQKLRDGRGWRLIGRNHDTAEFDAEGRLTTISDRHRRGQNPEDQGNTLHLRYDVFGQLIGVTDDLARAYELEYYDDPNPENEGGDGDKYGLLKKIIDFADREIEYEYDAERRLIKVKYPEVANPVDAYRDFSYEGQNRPFLEYTYDPQNGVETSEDDRTAILHGDFAELRLSEVFLPAFLEFAARVPRARFTYKKETGRLDTVGFPTPDNQNNGASSVEWTVEPGSTQRSNAAPLEMVTVRAPWGHTVDYTLEKGRTTKVEQLLEVAQPDGQVIPDVPVATEFAYTDDGRLEKITYPDGGERINCYADSDGSIGGCDGSPNNDAEVDHLAKANVVKALMRSTTQASRGTSEYQSIETTASYQEDNLVSSVTDGLSRGIQLAVPRADATDMQSFDSESVTSTFDFDSFGRIKEFQGGSTNPIKIDKEFFPNAADKDGAGLLKKARFGTGQFWSELDYDDQFNIDERKTSHGTRSETKFDSWDRPVRSISGLSDGRYRPTGSESCDENGTRSEVAYDRAGHVIRQRHLQDYVDFDGSVRCRWVETRYIYNALEQIIGIEKTHLSDPGQPGRVLASPVKTSESEYDEFGRVRVVRSLNRFAPALETLYRYDEAGRAVGVKVGDAGEQIRGYDVKNRLVLKRDGDEGVWVGRIDAWDRLYHQAKSTGSYQLSFFDKSSNLTEQQIYDADPLAPTGDANLLSRQQSHFNSFGSVDQIVTTLSLGGSEPQILVTQQEFDDAGRQVGVWSGPAKASGCVDISVSCLDTSKARREKQTVFEPQTGRVLEERFGGAFGSEPLYAHRYEYHPDNASPMADGMRYLEAVPGEVGLVETWSTSYERDAFGRIVTERKSNGKVIHTTYDRGSNRVIQTRNGTEAQSRFGYDGAGRLILVVRPNQRGRTTYAYDFDGRLLRQVTSTDDEPWETTFSHDRTGRVSRVDYHDGTYEERNYNPDNTLATLVSRDGVLLTYEYDAANRLLATTPSQATPLEDSLVALDAGDFAVWDELSRPLSLSRGHIGTAGIDPGLTVSYSDYDLASRVHFERVGTREALGWDYDLYSRPIELTLPMGLSRDQGSDFQGFSRRFDTLDRLQDIGSVGTLSSAVAGGTWSWGGANRLYGFDSKTALGTASRYGYIAGSGPQPAGDQPPASKWKLGTLTWGAGAGVATEVPGETWAQFAFGWRGVDGDPRDGAKIGRQVKRGLDAGGLDLFAGMGWAWEYDAGVRLSAAYPGRGSVEGRNLDDSDGYVFDYGEGDELSLVVDQANGRSLRVETGPYGRILSRDSVNFSYDRSGRRTEDERYVYRWNWRSELVEVTVKEQWPDGTVSPYAGHQIRFSYDAKGRLTERFHLGPDPNDGTERPLVERRDFVWEHQGLVSEVAFSDADAQTRRWRKTYVPGPTNMDDAAQVVVENFAFGSRALYTYLRDEIGTVVAVVAEEESQDRSAPTIAGRYLYTPYGEAHLESGPEVRRSQFEAGINEAQGQAQSLAEGHRPGGLRVAFSAALDPLSLAGQVVLEQLGFGGWQPVPAEQYLVDVDAEPTHLLVMTLEGWREEASYRVRIGPELRDTVGRRHGEQLELGWSVPSALELSIAYDQRHSVTFDSSKAASDSLGGRFPGGQSFLFQGLWTDPVVGLSYARARWYDSRNAAWLTEDPLADIDSPNLYAFVAWQPNMASDPQGLCLGLNDEPCYEVADRWSKKLHGWKNDVAAEGGGGASVAWNTLAWSVIDAGEMFVVDPLRAGYSTGDAIGSGAGGGEVALAMVEDFGRASSFVGPAAGLAKAAGVGGKGAKTLTNAADELLEVSDEAAALVDDVAETLTQVTDDAAELVAEHSDEAADALQAATHVDEAPVPAPQGNGQEYFGELYDEAKQLHLEDPAYFPDPDTTNFRIVTGDEARAGRAAFEESGGRGHHVHPIGHGGDPVPGPDGLTFTGESTIKADYLEGLDLDFYADYGKADAKILKIHQPEEGGVFIFGPNPRHTRATNFFNKVGRAQKKAGDR